MVMSIHLSRSWLSRSRRVSPRHCWIPKANVCSSLLSSLTPALAQKFGYSSVDAFKEGAQRKFSLVENGIVEKPSTRLLLVNVSSSRNELICATKFSTFRELTTA